MTHFETYGRFGLHIFSSTFAIRPRYPFVTEVGVVEVHKGLLEGSDQHWTILKQFLFQSCTFKMDKNLLFFIFLLLAGVLEVRVVEVHEGVLESSDQHGTVSKDF